MTVLCHGSGHFDSPAHTALLVTIGAAVALCSGCGSNDTASTSGEPARTATAACDVARPGPPSIDSALVAHLSRGYTVEEICASDVGPGFARPEPVAELSGLAAGEVTSSYSLPKDNEGLKVLVGTVKSGNGDAFVDAFLSRVGEAGNDTVTLGEHIVRYFNTPGGEGYAYAEGPTVVIGYIPPPSENLAIPEVGVTEVFTRIVAAAAGAPIPARGANQRRYRELSTRPGPLHHTRRPGLGLLQDQQPEGKSLRNRSQRLRGGMRLRSQTERRPRWCCHSCASRGQSDRRRRFGAGPLHLFRYTDIHPRRRRPDRGPPPRQRRRHMRRGLPRHGAVRDRRAQFPHLKRFRQSHVVRAS